jgi:hypothetical protein
MRTFRIPAYSKHRNRRTDGYDSQKEAHRAAELRLLERSGAIRNLRKQVSYEIVSAQADLPAIEYRLDFQYQDTADGRMHYEDVKGQKSGTAYRLFRLKKSLMLLVHGILVEEV